MMDSHTSKPDGGAVIRVVIADDQPLVRTGLSTVLNRSGDITVVAEVCDGNEARQAAHRHRPDVILMDIRMPVLDGIAATRHIAADLPEVRIIVLTTFDSDEHIFDAIAAGAAGFLVKSTTPDELRAAVRTVAAGDGLLSPSVTTRVLSRIATQSGSGKPAISDERLADVTQRERDVLSGVARGLSNQEIAAELYLSPATVRTYVSRLTTKLDARSRAELVVIAYENQLR